MKVLVCGGRDYRNRERVYKILDWIHASDPITLVIHGDARGADTLAKDWAIARGIDHKPFPADWTTHGKSAGPIRNREMLVQAKPQLVVAFPGGRGTGNMVAQARAAKVHVLDAKDG